MSTDGSSRIFISYSRFDEGFARRLATSLSNMGADVWIDVEDIPAGMKWSSAIQQGLDSGQLLIVVISPESMASRNVEDEWQYYLDSGKPVVPVLLRQTKIHFQLNRLQYIDFLSQDYDNAIRQLYGELWSKGLPLKPPPEDSAQEIPDLNSLSPEELQRWLTILQERQAALTQAQAPVDPPEPKPAAIVEPEPEPEAPRREPQATLVSQRRPEIPAQQPQPVSPPKSAPANRQPLIFGAVGLVALIAVVIVIALLSMSAQPDAENEKATSTAQAIAQANLTATSIIATASAEAPTADNDGDGLTNQQEAEYGTSIYDADTDGDGLSDSEEINGCTDPLSVDTDDDGTLDDTEVAEGTDCDDTAVMPGFSADNPVAHSNQWTIIERHFDGVPMVLVPTGSITMGTAPEVAQNLMASCLEVLQPGDCQGMISDESPVNTMYIEEPFWIDLHEVSNAQFQDFGGVAASASDWTDPQQPRTNVTWLEAEQFCETRGMTLPTETQWEYAARGPEGRTYPWGNEFTQAILNYCDASCTLDWRDAAHDDGYAVPAPVASFQQNASWVGALDMAGNVWEWTQTIYDALPDHSYEDLSDLESRRVLKGGSWNWVLQESRGAARSPHANNSPSSPWYGFRCARHFDPSDLDA